jgi:hypothetical protein
MTDKQAKALLDLASEKVPCGIYAIRKGADYYEMRNEPFESRTKLKQTRNAYRRAGIKVFCNGL